MWGGSGLLMANAVVNVPFSAVSLLIHGGRDPVTTFPTDSSSFAVNTPLTTAAITYDTTSWSLLGNSVSLGFSSTLNTYIKYTSAAQYNFGSGDFTLECQIKTGASYVNASQYLTLFSKAKPDGTEYEFIFYALNGSLILALYNSSGTLTANTATYTFAASTAYQIGVTRSGTTVKIYVNNTLIYTGTNATAIRSTGGQPLYIGELIAGFSHTEKFMKEIRITKGYARDLTIVQTAPFPNA